MKKYAIQFVLAWLALVTAFGTVSLAQTYLMRRAVSGIGPAEAALTLPTCAAGEVVTSDGNALSCQKAAADIISCRKDTLSFGNGDQNSYIDFTAGECGGTLPDSNYLPAFAGFNGSCGDIAGYDIQVSPHHLHIRWQGCSGGGFIQALFIRKAS